MHPTAAVGDARLRASAGASAGSHESASSGAGETRRVSESRRTTKPIMEKRRRARINCSLNVIKNLVLDFNKASKDSARHSKLEKADILEMAVRHLQTLHRQVAARRAAADPNVGDKFRAGYLECAREVQRFLGRLAESNPSFDPTIRESIAAHLAARLGPPAGAAAPTTNGAAAAVVVSVPVGSSNTSSGARQPIACQAADLSTSARSTSLHSPTTDHLQQQRYQHHHQQQQLQQLQQQQLTHQLQQLVQQQQTGRPLQQPPSLEAAQLTGCGNERPVGPGGGGQISINTAVSVLGSSGILSPAASDRSSPATSTAGTPCGGGSVARIAAGSPLIVKDESVWRPW